MRFAAALAWLVLSAGAVAAQQPGRAPVLEARRVWGPGRVVIDGTPWIYYELMLANRSAEPLRVRAIDLAGARPDTLLETFAGRALAARWEAAKRGAPGSGPVLAPHDSAIVYFEHPEPAAEFVVFRARLGGRAESGGRDRTVLIGGGYARRSAVPSTTLGPPLRSGPWAAVYSPDWDRGHRRVSYAVDGRPRLPGRFAIDFVRLDDGGRTGVGDQDSVTNWYGYDQEVLAVADGSVRSVRTDVAESGTLSGHLDPSAAEAAGNYVALGLADGRVVFYEHLRPGSVRVRPGQRVTRGTVIGRLGFTGQSTGPHLHLHVADADAALGAEGLPFGFDSFQLLGGYPDFSRFGREGWRPVAGRFRGVWRERPPPNSVVRFAP